jgi:hypothetical protein
LTDKIFALYWVVTSERVNLEFLGVMQVWKNPKRSIALLVSWAGTVDTAGRHHATHGARDFLERHHRSPPRARGLQSADGLVERELAGHE